MEHVGIQNKTVPPCWGSNPRPSRQTCIFIVDIVVTVKSLNTPSYSVDLIDIIYFLHCTHLKTFGPRIELWRAVLEDLASTIT